MNGAPGSSAAVLADHAGANISNVRRPRSKPLQPPMISAMAVPIFGSNSKSNVQVGASITPSSVVNSCTTMLPMSMSSDHEHDQAGGGQGRQDRSDPQQ